MIHDRLGRVLDVSDLGKTSISVMHSVHNVPVHLYIPVHLVGSMLCRQILYVCRYVMYADTLCRQYVIYADMFSI